MSNIRFKSVEDSHLLELLEIYNYYVEKTTVTFHNELLDLEKMKTIVYNRDRFDSFTIFCDDEICGYVLLSPYKDRKAYDVCAEVTVYVKQGYMKKGIGSSAMAYIEEVARGHEFMSLIGIICAENTASITLFEKLGYTKAAHLHNVGMKFGRVLDIVNFEKSLV